MSLNHSGPVDLPTRNKKRPTKLEQHLTPDEVATMLRVHRQTILNLLKPGQIWPYVKIGSRSIRIPVSSVLAYLKSRRNG